VTATTQQTTREQLWVRYLRLNAMASDAMADAYEAEKVAAKNDPTMTPDRLEARLAHLDDIIASWRRMAESGRKNADDEEAEGCVCGGTGRMADHPCARCTPDLSPTDASGLLAAMKHSIHEEASHG
jgi:hypothetical protein